MFVVCLAGPEKKVIFGGGPKVGSLGSNKVTSA